MTPSIYFIVPCYNEEENIASSIEKLIELIDAMGNAKLCDRNLSGVLLVDDGSNDSTWNFILDQSISDDRIKAIRLSRNKGHQAALIAGIENIISLADATITIDADLQDDIKVCPDMLRLMQTGIDIVYGVRRDRKADDFIKRFFANSFYSISLALGIEIIHGHADFRLLSRKAMKELLRYKERVFFMRGIVPLLGYNSAMVYYDRIKRKAGTSKYPIAKSVSLAVDGILSFSNAPLILIPAIGTIGLLLSIAGIAWVGAQLILAKTVPGWASIMVFLMISTSMQLIALGIIGGYLGKLYSEVKRRPRFHVMEKIGLQNR